MTLTAFSELIRSAINTMLNVPTPTTEIIFSNENGPQPKTNFLMVEYAPEVNPIGQMELLSPNVTTGVSIFIQPTEATLEIQEVNGNGDKLQSLSMLLDSPTWTQYFSANGVSLLRKSSIRAIPTDVSTAWKKISIMDLIFSFPMTVQINTGVIEHITYQGIINGNVGGTPIAVPGQVDAPPAP